MTTENTESVRVDRWLWAARFYKTRGLAASAIKGGKITLNGDRVAKPSKTVKLGDELHVRRDAYRYEITLTGLAEKRGSATVAATLYQESESSIAKRAETAAALKANATGVRYDAGRPSKRDRREIDRIRRINEAT